MNNINKITSNIIENISIERLSSYRLNSTDTDDLVLKRYLFNIKVSESFYPIISALEIALRNRLYYAIAKIKGEDWLFREVDKKDVLSDNERGILLESYKKMVNKHGSDFKVGILIAELTFGFWVNLCKKSYKNSLWDKQDFFTNVFPTFDDFFVCSVLDKTKVIFPELKAILQLRNRIFHHEIIINNKIGIENCYEKMHKVLYSLSKDYAEIFEQTFRFKDVINQKP